MASASPSHVNQPKKQPRPTADERDGARSGMAKRFTIDDLEFAIGESLADNSISDF